MSYNNLEEYLVPASYFTQGGLWLWGYNNYGQLGDNTVTSGISPIQTIASGTNWKQVFGGRRHTVGIKTDGTLWTWGQNTYASLGDNTTTHKSSPVQTISGGTNWKLVAGGRYHIAAIKTDGSLWLWGYGGNGQLGDNTTTTKSSPVQTVAGGNNWKSVFTCFASYNSAAIKTDGTLWTWGHNNYGQLGNTTTTNTSSPIQTIAAGNNWKLVSGGRTFTTGIKTDGTLWVWGNNGYGQLGTGNTTHQSSPVQTISGGTNWKLVNCGIYFTTAIKTDGTLWTWGQNSDGALGDNTILRKSSPVQTVTGGTNWKLVTGCTYTTSAIKTDGTLWLWGRNSYGQLGDNTGLAKSSPIQTVAGGTNWKSLGGGYDHTVAINGTWGTIT
jgi:alpha-tubulin suppressor-like RCC1 family protein